MREHLVQATDLLQRCLITIVDDLELKGRIYPGPSVVDRPQCMGKAALSHPGIIDAQPFRDLRCGVCRVVEVTHMCDDISGNLRVRLGVLRKAGTIEEFCLLLCECR